MDELLQKQAKARKNILYLTVGIITFVLVVNVGLGSLLAKNKQASTSSRKITPTQVVQQPSTDTFSYNGKTGKDALMILKAKTSVEQDKSGLVVSINGRKADTTKHEFWEFIVNGKEANVGPHDYMTKNSDVIEWKITHY